MVKGAVYPNTSNFKRAARLDVVARVRRLCEVKLMNENPVWLEWCERVPPLENHNLYLQQRTVRNPYPRMVEFLLKKYPDLRFQDCYVDGNDWSSGNDMYRNDHPAMQFVARQLDLMRTKGLSKKEAFAETEKAFRERRDYLEREQKVMMAMALDSGVAPMFSTGRAYLDAEKARAEMAHLNKIRRRLREMKQAKEREEAVKEQAQLREEAAEGLGVEDEDIQPLTYRDRIRKEDALLRASEKERVELLGAVPREREDWSWKEEQQLTKIKIDDEGPEPATGLESKEYERNLDTEPDEPEQVRTKPERESEPLEEIIMHSGIQRQEDQEQIAPRRPGLMSAKPKKTKAQLKGMMGGGVLGEERGSDGEDKAARRRTGMDDDDDYDDPGSGGRGSRR